MNADIKGALEQLNKSYDAFEHKGKRMTKEQVRKVLEYGLQKGYTHTGQLTDEEVDSIILNMTTTNTITKISNIKGKHYDTIEIRQIT